MFFLSILTKKLNKSKDRELPPDDEHLINPADIPTVAPKFVKIVDQWKSRSGSGDGDHKRDSGGLERAQRKPSRSALSKHSPRRVNRLEAKPKGNVEVPRPHLLSH